MSQFDAAIRFCGLFEAELLVDLMLRYWEHPCAGDREVVNDLERLRLRFSSKRATDRSVSTGSTPMT